MRVWFCFLFRIDSEGDSDYIPSPTWSVDEEDMSTSTGGSPGVEGDSGYAPDIDESLSCDRVAAIQESDMAVLVQVCRCVSQDLARSPGPQKTNFAHSPFGLKEECLVSLNSEETPWQTKPRAPKMQLLLAMMGMSLDSERAEQEKSSRTSEVHARNSKFASHAPRDLLVSLDLSCLCRCRVTTQKRWSRKGTSRSWQQWRRPPTTSSEDECQNRFVFFMIISLCVPCGAAH